MSIRPKSLLGKRFSILIAIVLLLRIKDLTFARLWQAADYSAGRFDIYGGGLNSIVALLLGFAE
jgi:hypothetical protein